MRLVYKINTLPTELSLFLRDNLTRLKPWRLSSAFFKEIISQDKDLADLAQPFFKETISQEKDLKS